MNSDGQPSGARGWGALRNFAAKAPAMERCDLCAAVVPEEHQHLIDPQTRRLLCACNPCAILFTSAGETKYRRVPREIYWLKDFVLTDQVWNSLAIPIGLAFIFSSSASGETLTVYPSPAGPTETVLDEESWKQILENNPELSNLALDVEALLINRINGAREYFRLPIDQAYGLVGVVRRYWRGFSGGEEGQRQITEFFDGLKERSSSAALYAYARPFV